MMYSEKYGNSIDEAVELALKQLKANKEDVEITVLEEPSRGFLGLGSKLAKVRVSLKEEEKQPEPAAPEVAQEIEAPKTEVTSVEKKPAHSEKKSGNRNHKKNKSKASHAKSTSNADSAIARPDDLVEVQEHKALDFLKETTEKMGLNLTFKAYENKDNLFVDIFGKDSGTVIGKRGQTLDAMQYLTSLVVNKEGENYVRVVLDAENYRSKRKKTLENLAERLATKVARTGKTVRLEPMNPYERMIIHATLQNDQRVVTSSEGEEPYRRVIITLK